MAKLLTSIPERQAWHYRAASPVSKLHPEGKAGCKPAVASPRDKVKHHVSWCRSTTAKMIEVALKLQNAGQCLTVQVHIPQAAWTIYMQ